MADILSSTWTASDNANTSAAPNGMPTNAHPSTVAPTMRQIMGATKRLAEMNNAMTTSSGSATDYAITYSVAPSALVKGMKILFFAHITNTGEATLNVNGLGAKPIVLNNNVPLSGGQITAGNVQIVVYDGTVFRLQNQTTNPTFSGTVKAQDISATGTISSGPVTNIRGDGNRHLYFTATNGVQRALIYNNGTDNSIRFHNYNADGSFRQEYTFSQDGDVIGFRNLTFSGGLYGSGANLSALNASSISSGTLSDARIPFDQSSKQFSDSLYIKAGGNKHLWFRNNAGVSRSLIYHSEADNALRLLQYNGDGGLRHEYAFGEDGDIRGVREIFMNGTLYNGDARYQSDGNIYMPWAGTHLSTVLAGKLNLSGGTMTGPLTLSAAHGTTQFQTGNGDAASYTTHNVRLKGWNGMGMSTYDDTVNGFYDFRAGKWDTKGGFFKNGVEAVYNNGGTYGINISGGAQYATGAGNATSSDRASALRQNGAGSDMFFNWSGQGGQPTWLWGGENGNQMYVYNPANFSVNNAGNLNGQNAAFYRNASNLDAGTLSNARLPATMSAKTINDRLTIAGGAPILNLAEDTGSGIANWYLVGDGAGLSIRYGDLGNTLLDMSPIGTITWLGNKVWHAGNDGSGSGLDADLLDGQDMSFYRNASNLNAGTIDNARLPETMSFKRIRDSVHITAGGNKHLWFTNDSGVNRGLIYHSEGDNALRFLQYNGDGSVRHEYTFTQDGDIHGARNMTFGESIGVGGSGVPVGPFNNGKAIGIGDSDTGIRQNGDGVLELWANGVNRFSLTSNAYFNVDSFKVNGVDIVRNDGGNYGINISGSAAYAAGAGNAASADRAVRLMMHSGGADAAFNWSGQGGQPQWLWGGNDPNNMFVYNPGNFSVDNAAKLGGVVAGDFMQHSQFRGQLGSIGVDEVGCVAVLYRASSATLNQGDTSLGSQLRFSNLDGSNISSNAPNGTWRALSRLVGATGNMQSVGLFRRIS